MLFLTQGLLSRKKIQWEATAFLIQETKPGIWTKPGFGGWAQSSPQEVTPYWTNLSFSWQTRHPPPSA